VLAYRHGMLRRVTCDDTVGESHSPQDYRSLSDTGGPPTADGRALYAAERSRLRIGAKVGSYLAVLTQSNERGMLRRKTLAAEAARMQAVACAELRREGR
jgi:hypothetical protein